MATDQLINKTQGDAIIAGLTAIKNAINDQPAPTQVEDVVSDAFDVGVSYVPGDYCIYENKLYKCDVAHHGAWDGNDFTLTNVGAELDTLNNALVFDYTTMTQIDSQTVNAGNTISYTIPNDGVYLFRLQNNAVAAAKGGTLTVNGVTVGSIRHDVIYTTVWKELRLKKGAVITANTPAGGAQISLYTYLLS